MDRSVYGPQGVYTFRIQGQLYHRIGSLLPPPGKEPVFSQIYIYDSNSMHQAQQRLSHSHDLLDINIVLSLQAMFERYNPYIQMFLTARERLAEHSNVSLHIKLVDLPHYDSRRYNRPTAGEIAVIMVGTGDEPNMGRDIVLQARRYGLQRIRETHSSYNPLRYPLLFPFGEQGWHINMHILTRYVSTLVEFESADRCITGGILLTRSLNVSIIPFSFIIDKDNITFSIELDCFSRSTLWMPMLKSSKAAWTSFDSIRTNFVQNYIEELSTPRYVDWSCLRSAICLSFLHHSRAVHERCGNYIKTPWRSYGIVASRTCSSR